MRAYLHGASQPQRAQHGSIDGIEREVGREIQRVRGKVVQQYS
jgi:hypothetical protein